jgi:PAS domain-containing protein
MTSPTARRIVAHWADPRPAWLWSRDGSSLIWRNAAARLFNARLKKGTVRLSPEPIPIKGLVARLIRLGAPGRASLSRVQFLSGGKPVAATCSCTPVTLWDGEAALLLVGVDPVPTELAANADLPATDALITRLLPQGTSYALVRDGAVIEGNKPGTAQPIVQLPADSRGTEFLLYPAAPVAETAVVEDLRREEGVADDDSDRDLADMPEPLLPFGLAPLTEPPVSPEVPSGEWMPPTPLPSEYSLSSLFDRLAEDADLYSALSAADETLGGAPSEEPETDAEPARPQPDLIGSVIEYADDPEEDAPPAAIPPPSHWLITGRGFRALTPEPEAAGETPPTGPPDTEAIATVDAAPDAETAQRVSRYNFEELGRILSDRVSGEEPPVAPESPATPRPQPPGVINLSAETLVLNRLPLAILVFRDQQVLFANRALTDLLGHEGVESLRAAGIASIFPSEEAASAGPVNRLVRRDGTPLPVTARLQSVSWQGRAALMLSASPAEAIRGHEGAVRAFAAIAAETRQEGFLAADRAGLVTEISATGAALLGGAPQDITGRPLAVLVASRDMEPLRAFLEKPARFAETARPSVVAISESGDADVTLFAEGQAGTVTGYFGFIRKRSAAHPAPASDEPNDPAMFGRLSRGIRRPLNTIIGFADLIRSAALGSLDASRYTEYARDIRTAGLEIAVLVDELDDYARLRDGGYAARPSDVELGALLESCVLRVKAQAGAARVLVRSAVAERLPRVRADRASLSQALLNLLASAIDQTPIGGSVILSAQLAEDGGIAVHVRDGSPDPGDLAERFVVFRDGVDKDGEQLQPVRSSVGLALTRSLLAVNACSLSIDPVAGAGTLFSLLIPAELVTSG